MKYVALAMLLAVMQASPPTPRKAANNPAQTPAQVKSKSAPSQAKPLPAPDPTKANGNGPAKADSSERHPKDADHDIGVSKLPPVTINPPKRDLADWGYWAFSGLLVIVGGLQVWLLFETLSAIRRQGDQMEHQTNALRRQGVSMRRQTTILRKSATLMEGQLGEMQKSTEIETKTLLLQYRPHIVIREVSLSDFDTHELGKPQHVRLKFSVVNTGGSPAHITEGKVRIVCGDSTAHKTNYFEGDWGALPPFTLEPGQDHPFDQTATTGVVNSIDWANFHAGLQSGSRFIYVMGDVFYADDLNIPRRSAFSRIYDNKTRRMKISGDPDEEYTD